MDSYDIIERGGELYETENSAYNRGDIVGMASAQQGMRALEDELMSESDPKSSNSMFYRALKPVLAGASLLTSAIAGAGIAKDSTPSLEDVVVYHTEDNSEHPMKLFEYNNDENISFSECDYKLSVKTVDDSEFDNKLSYLVSIAKTHLDEPYCNDVEESFFASEPLTRGYPSAPWQYEPNTQSIAEVKELQSEDNTSLDRLITLDLDKMVAGRYGLALVFEDNFRSYNYTYPLYFKEFYVLPEESGVIDNMSVSFDHETGKLNVEFNEPSRKFFPQTYVFRNEEDPMILKRDLFILDTVFTPLDSGFEIDTKDPSEQYIQLKDAGYFEEGDYNLRAIFLNSGDFGGYKSDIFNDEHLEELINNKISNDTDADILVVLNNYETRLNNIRWDESDSCWKVDLKLDEASGDVFTSDKDEGTLCSIPITTAELQRNYENGSNEAKSKIVSEGSALDDSGSQFRTRMLLGNHFNIFHITDQNDILKVFSYSVLRDGTPVETFYSLDDDERYRFESIDIKFYRTSLGSDRSFREIVFEHTEGDSLESVISARRITLSDNSIFPYFGLTATDPKILETQYSIKNDSIDEIINQVTNTPEDDKDYQNNVSDSEEFNKTLVTSVPENKGNIITPLAGVVGAVAGISLLRSLVKNRKNKDDLGEWDVTKQIENQFELEDLTYLAAGLNGDSEE